MYGFLLVTGVFLLYLFTPHLRARWEGETADEKRDPHTTGQLERIEPTVYYINKKVVKAYHYSYEGPSGRRHQGVSYSEEDQAALAPGQPLTVHYKREQWDVSVAAGLRSQVLPFWHLVMFSAMALGFVLVGLLLGRHALRQRLLAIELLATGRFTKGTLINKTSLSGGSKKRREYRMTFEFYDQEGGLRTTTVVTSEPHRLEDEGCEPLLYDPQNPDQAVLLDSLPSGAREFALQCLEENPPLSSPPSIQPKGKGKGKGSVTSQAKKTQ